MQSKSYNDLFMLAVFPSHEQLFAKRVISRLIKQAKEKLRQILINN